MDHKVCSCIELLCAFIFFNNSGISSCIKLIHVLKLCATLWSSKMQRGVKLVKGKDGEF